MPHNLIWIPYLQIKCNILNCINDLFFKIPVHDIFPCLFSIELSVFILLGFLKKYSAYQYFDYYIMILFLRKYPAYKYFDYYIIIICYIIIKFVKYKIQKHLAFIVIYIMFVLHFNFVLFLSMFMNIQLFITTRQRGIIYY